MAKIYIIVYVISKIENNECYKHRYMIFFIPAILIIAEHLSLYHNERHLQSYRLFTFLIRRVNVIMKEENKQLGEQEVINYLTIAISYRKNAKAIQDALK